MSSEVSPWNYGYNVQLIFTEERIKFRIYPYEQCGKDAKIKLLENNAFDEKLQKLNEIISKQEKLAQATHKYYNESMNGVEFFLCPYQHRIVRGLIKYGLFPSPYKKKWLLKLQNYICCESHKDKVEYFLLNKKN